MRLIGGGAAMLAVVAAVLAGAGAAQPPPVHAAMQSFSLPGDGPWDYVTYDPAHRRVFIGRYDGVQVVRADTGRLELTIGSRGGDHGVVIAPDQQRVFTSDARAHQLGVYNQASLAAQRSVALGGAPDGLAYDPASHRVLAFLPQSHEIVAVDARTLQVAGRLDAGGEAEAAAVDGRGAVFVTLRDQGEIIRLNAATLKIGARWKIGCERPSPIALNAASGRLFVGCRDQRMLVLDAQSGASIASVPTGEGTDAIAFDPVRHLVIAANGRGSISLARAEGADTYAALGGIVMPVGARTMAVDAAGGRLFTTTADIARTEPPTPKRPYPRLIPVLGTFRMIVVRLPPP